MAEDVDITAFSKLPLNAAWTGVSAWHGWLTSIIVRHTVRRRSVRWIGRHGYVAYVTKVT